MPPLRSENHTPAAERPQVRPPGTGVSRQTFGEAALDGSVNAHRDRADIAGATTPHAQKRGTPAVAKDRIDRVAGVASRPACIRRLPVGEIGLAVREVELARVDDVAAHV